MLRSDDAAAGVVDLSDAVTVFVATVGAPTLAACMAHLQAQDCRFTLRLIENVAPMNVAFQRMLDECTTPYYVQVDEDMLLDPHAVRTLHERIEATSPRAAMFVATLFDVHLARCIIGVKIYRHDVVRRYPLAMQDSFESDQARRIEADGYPVVRVPVTIEPVPGDTLGLHGTRWTAPLIYERYAKLERRRILEARTQWFAPYASEFLARFQREPTEENFFALMGIIAGVLGSRQGTATAKDYRTYDDLPGYAALREFLAAFPPPLVPIEAPAAADPDASPRRRDP